MPDPKDQNPNSSEASGKTGSTKTSDAASVSASSALQQKQVLTPAIADAFAEFGVIAATLGIQPKADDFEASARACKTEPDWCLPEPDCAARYSLTLDQRKVLSSHLEKCNPVIVQ